MGLLITTIAALVVDFDFVELVVTHHQVDMDFVHNQFLETQESFDLRHCALDVDASVAF